MTTFLLKVVDQDLYLNIPDCQETKVILGPSKCKASILVLEQGLLKSTERPHLYLVIENGSLVLSRDKKKAWKYDEIKLNNDLKVAQNDTESLKFSLVHEDMPKPATSCHLRYEIQEEIGDNWQLECTVQVENSSDCTYFCVTGWGPGGYCGIQQLPNNKRKAIFSMWNDHFNSVELIEAGKDVEVSEFGGEGTGIKTMKDFDWLEHENVTFKVCGNFSNGFWYCECSIIHQGQEELMAILMRPGSTNPLNKTGFYSFIEDWDRCEHAEGFKHLRKAKFLWPKFNGTRLKEATFTKVESGCDAFACDLARGTPCIDGFVLETGTKICQNNTVLHSLN